MAQFNLLNYILDNKIVHWENVNNPNAELQSQNQGLTSFKDYTNLDFFNDWIVGFTIAEGSFGFKARGSAFFQIKQKGLENYEILKAIYFTILCRELNPTKPDTSNAYQIAMTSKSDVQKVLNFFSSKNNHPLLGYKLIQYEKWLIALKASNRYKDLIIV